MESLKLCESDYHFLGQGSDTGVPTGNYVMRKAQVCLDSGTFGLFVLGHRNLRFRDGISNTGGLGLKIKFSNYLLVAVLQALLAVCGVYK